MVSKCPHLDGFKRRCQATLICELLNGEIDSPNFDGKNDSSVFDYPRKGDQHYDQVATFLLNLYMFVLLPCILVISLLWQSWSEMSWVLTAFDPSYPNDPDRNTISLWQFPAG